MVAAQWWQPLTADHMLLFRAGQLPWCTRPDHSIVIAVPSCSETYVLKQQGHYYDVAASAFSPDGAYLVTGADDAKVRALAVLWQSCCCCIGVHCSVQWHWTAPSGCGEGAGHDGCLARVARTSPTPT